MRLEQKENNKKREKRKAYEQLDMTKQLELDAALRLLAERLPSWFLANRRTLPWRGTGNPYDVWLSEIMLQQTRVEAVKGYFLRFKQALPDIASLAACPDDALMKLWEGLGYYSRVRNLKKAAQVMVEQYGGALPADEQALLKLPGIGDYTAGAIASIAYGLPVPAVDGNVLRVCMRVSGNDADIALPETKKLLAQALRASVYDELGSAQKAAGDSAAEENEDCAGDKDMRGEKEMQAYTCANAPYEKDGWLSNRSGLFTQALMELGALVCVPNGEPLCHACPVREGCYAFQKKAWERLPVKSAKKPRRIEEKTVLLIQNGTRFAIRKRPEKGLLAGLWELPSVSGKLDAAEAERAVRKLGFAPLSVRKRKDAKHIFTHIEWHMCAYHLTVSAEQPMQDVNAAPSDGTLVFASAEELRSVYALPSAFQAYLEDIRGTLSRA